jgi:hypothetical protein
MTAIKAKSGAQNHRAKSCRKARPVPRAKAAEAKSLAEAARKYRARLQELSATLDIPIRPLPDHLALKLPFHLKVGGRIEDDDA